MRNKTTTRNFYVDALGFVETGATAFDEYLMIRKDNFEIHFFLFTELNPLDNDGQVYIRTDAIDTLYRTWKESKVPIHPNGHLETKPWQQKEFSILDPDHNLLTFGQEIHD